MSDVDFDFDTTTVSDTRPLEEDNVFKDINDYLDENTSSETMKCTKKCQKLFDDVMKSFHERSGTSFLPLDQYPVTPISGPYPNQVLQPNPQNIFQYQNYYVTSTNCSGTVQSPPVLDRKEDENKENMLD